MRYATIVIFTAILLLPARLGGFTPPKPPVPIQLYDTVRLLFIGDVMQHGKQVKAALAAGNPAAPEDPLSYNYSTTFKYIAENLRRADIAAANMEFPVGDYPYGFYPNFNSPATIALEAKRSGINLFLTANNHMADQGGKGLEKTLQIYDTLGVRYIGSYRSADERESREPLIIRRKGIKIAFINFCYGLNCALDGKCVVNRMDSTLICRYIERAKEGGADLIVALPHWGEEYKSLPNKQQRRWAEMLFERGVRLIVGTHPHVPQLAEIELKSNGELKQAAIYSLGNYISNQSTPNQTQLGLMAEIALCRNRLTGKVTVTAPQITPLWCFKAGEYENNYTVLPISGLLAHPERVAIPKEYERASTTYEQFKRENLIRVSRCEEETIDK